MKINLIHILSSMKYLLIILQFMISKFIMMIISQRVNISLIKANINSLFMAKMIEIELGLFIFLINLFFHLKIKFIYFMENQVWENL